MLFLTWLQKWPKIKRYWYTDIFSGSTEKENECKFYSTCACEALITTNKGAKQYGPEQLRYYCYNNNHVICQFVPTLRSNFLDDVWCLNRLLIQRFKIRATIYNPNVRIVFRRCPCHDRYLIFRGVGEDDGNVDQKFMIDGWNSRGRGYQYVSDRSRRRVKSQRNWLILRHSRDFGKSGGKDC